MRETKYVPNRELDSKKWFLKWNNPSNPFGNFHEPLPFPQKRRDEGPKNDFLAFLWWQFYRNPLHNYTHFRKGIVPVGNRYEWVTPDDDGWVRDESDPDKKCWVRKNKRLCRRYFKFWVFEGYMGWAERGSWGFALRKR